MNVSLGSLLNTGAEPPVQCSRASCSAPATDVIRWRNPKIHSADREKQWLTCPDHLDYLRQFLQARAFPVRVTPFPGDEVDASES